MNEMVRPLHYHQGVRFSPDTEDLLRERGSPGGVTSSHRLHSEPSHAHNCRELILSAGNDTAHPAAED